MKGDDGKVELPFFFFSGHQALLKHSSARSVDAFLYGPSEDLPQASYLLAVMKYSM